MRNTESTQFYRRRSPAGRGGGCSASAQQNPVKRAIYPDGKKPAKPGLYTPTIALGNLLLSLAWGAVPGDIKSHTRSFSIR